MPAYGADQTTLRWLRRPATWLFVLYTRLAYRRLAGQVARDIGDYVRSGQIRTGGGWRRRLAFVWGAHDVGSQGVVDTIAGCDLTKLNTDDFNRRVIAGHARAGQGMFITALRRQLRRRGLDVQFDEHDLIAEITD